MFHLHNLTVLRLSSNHLSGLVDFHKVLNMQFLEILDLSDNNFLYLSFNSTRGDYTFPNLQYLDLSKNQIHGRIPKWFNSTGKDTLSVFDLSHNLLTSVGYLSLSWASIHYIDLSFNMLQGDIPIPPSGTKFFSVSHNKLTGHISSTICNASSLQMLDLSHNNLAGKLPQCLGTFPYLSVLDLRTNNLSGMIPKNSLEIEALETMNFNGNQLEGPLPRSVVMCKQLRVLDLGENNIQDTFPTFLESL
ncbi:hypothetical protein JHK86_040525 [Glycine max]|nr:hypothetical protein JHK86_040525 [Glycine max]